MQKEIQQTWFKIALKRLETCVLSSPSDVYILGEYLLKSLQIVDLSPRQKFDMHRDFYGTSLKNENSEGPSTRWTFTCFDYTDQFLKRLKRKVDKLGIYIRFERYTLNSRYPSTSDIHFPLGDQPRIYGYILTNRPYHGDEIRQLVETQNFMMAGFSVTIQEYDDSMDKDYTWYGDEKLHDEVCESMKYFKPYSVFEYLNV